MLRKSLLSATIAVTLSVTTFSAHAELLTQRGTFAGGGAEIVAYRKDGSDAFLYVTNANDNSIEIINASDVDAPSAATPASIDLSSYGGGVNSVAVHNGTIAVAVEATVKTDPGKIVFFDNSGAYIHDVTVGALPDMVTFTPDGSKVLVANEGEPSDTVDPEGSISIIDISAGVASATVTTADFTAFNGQESTLRDKGVRLFPNKSVAEDVEPEYIAVSKDGTTARVSLQEANALAVLDLTTNTITDIQPLGLKDHSIAGNGLDASNKDDKINIQNWPVFGMYMPDSIASFEVGGSTYFVTANEGDSRDTDENRVKDDEVVLDPTAFPNAAELKDSASLGRLKISNIDGDTDGDGDFDKLYSYGARSFSIWDVDGNQVFDSGEDFEQITAKVLGTLGFNSTDDENDSFDNRSDDKGPEPEAITTGTLTDGTTYAFIGLERAGGIMAYDISNPQAAKFTQYINNRDFSQTDITAAGDFAPEGMTFISAADSHTGEALLIVANEVSNTTTIYSVADKKPDLFCDGFEAFACS